MKTFETKNMATSVQPRREVSTASVSTPQQPTPAEPIGAESVLSSGGRRLPYMDGLRAVAMLFVFVYHSHLFALTPEGGSSLLRTLLTPFSMSFGTSLFVVISGFCLYLPVARKPHENIKMGRFLARRMYRIYPPYFFALCIYTALAAAITIRGGIWIEGPNSLREMNDSFLAHLFLLQAFVPQYCFSLNHPLWTLTLECSNYVVFPVLVLLFRRFKPLYCYFAALLVVLFVNYAAGRLFDAGYLSEGALLVLKNSFLMRGSEFFAGMLAAQVIVGKQPRGDAMTLGKIRVTWRWLLAGSALVFAFGVWLFLHRLMSNHIFGLSALLMILAVSLPGTANRPNPLHTLLSSKPLSFIGLISYSFYLVHEPLLRLLLTLPWMAHMDRTAAFFFSITILFAVIVGIAVLFDVLCVKPFRGRNRDKALEAPACDPGLARMPGLQATGR